ncbi:hypothetical protein [Arthrobacter bambusae]|uniref:Uncharacterized protein n=1 Tax=Arthrobacter bambusae TaxID=1338426 RepID=A0AAW8DEH8_9MICC|nr:hypothetical protein [Arthrobacter bambusae]MDP9904680.1 hypothetical protein [Arthrobacter bambusae]MDQ0129496.1 hypothetical protein [Arthrobacter bambusae]MDQ0180891.1 hypothetical protein [Arthrobacter bambusae]
MTTNSAGQGPDVVIVDAGAMQDLTEKYTEYRELLYGGGIFDPCRTIHLTGEVLASVRNVLVTAGRAQDTAEPAGEDKRRP